MTHFFISYAKADTRSLAFALADALEAPPHTTAWVDKELRVLDASWSRQIEREIKKCDYMILLLSPDVNRPEDHKKGESFVLREIRYAQQVRKRIIPVMAQQTDVPIELIGGQYIDFTGRSDREADWLIEVICTEIGIQNTAQWQKEHQREAERLRAEASERARIKAQQHRFSVPPAARQFPTEDRQIIEVPDFVTVRELAILVSVSPVEVMKQLIGNGIMASINEKLDYDTAAIVIHNLGFKAQYRKADKSESSPNRLGSRVRIFAGVGLIIAFLVVALASFIFRQNNSSNIPTVTKNSDWTPQIKTFDGVEMVIVPPGCFMMGSDSGDDDEKPVNQQCFDQPFYIDRFEVTNEQFAQFGGQAATTSYWTDAKRPRERITWFEARDGCAKRGARLPTEAEWEYAARGPDGLIYPWGNTFVADNVVYDGNSGSQTATVGSKLGGVSWVGALDMSGNVWEWVSTIYQSYPYSETDGRESISNTNSPRVLRGGSWSFDDNIVRAAIRIRIDPGGRYNLIGHGDVGFRCARSF